MFEIVEVDMFSRDYTFLAIDDSTADATLLRRYLQKIPDLRFEFVHCTKSEEGWATLAEWSFDCIFLDQQLGGIRGVELLREMRQAGVDTPVILFTGHGGEAVAVEAMRAGAQDYIAKGDLNPEHLQLSLERVFERKNLERSLVENRAELARTTEERDRFFNLSPDMFCIVDWQGLFQSLNPAWTQVLGYGQGVLAQTALVELVHHEDQSKTREMLAQLQADPTPVSFENRCLHNDGHYRWLRWNAVSQEQTQRIYATARDITQARLAQVELREARDHLEKQVAQRTVELVERNRELEEYQERLRSLTSALALAEERERRRLAMDLHDSIGQDLALAKGKVGLLKATQEAVALSAPLGEIQTLLDQIIQQTRTLTFELSPPILHELGLEVALEWLAEQTQNRHGLDVQIAERGARVALKDDRRIIVFRAVRELLFNVIKHAQAHSIRIDIRREAEMIFVSVKDDGKGFDTSLLAAVDRSDRGFGLFSIQERMDSLGGTIAVDAKVGEGTCVVLAVPWQDRRKRARKDV